MPIRSNRYPCGSFFDDLEESPAVDVSGTGVGAIVGSGYDIYLGRNLSLTTAVDFRFSRIGSVTLDGQSGFRGWKHNVIDFTVGIKFNWRTSRREREYNASFVVSLA